MPRAYLDNATQGKARNHQRRRARQPSGLRNAALVQTLAALLWIPQAGLLSVAVGRIADGGGIDAVIWPAIVIALLGVLKSCLDAAGGRLAFRAARAELSLRRARVVEALARRSPVDNTRQTSGEAASIVGEQAELIVPYLARFQPARFKASAVPLVILACVFPISWMAALVLLFAMPLIPVFMALIGWRAQAASEKQLAATGGLNGFLLDRLRGLATIRALGAVDATATRLRADAEDLKTRTMAVLRIAFLSSAVLELFAALGVAMVAVYIGFSLLGEIRFGAWTGGLELTSGLFVLLLAPAFFEPLRELSAVWHDRASGEAAMKALDALSQDGMLLPQGEPALGTLSTDIRFRAVTFRYPGSDASAVERYDLHIRAGEHVALLGPSGSGKSTLLALAAGLAPCQSGRVEIGGQPAGRASRMRIAWIGQKPHIFAGAITRNVSLGRPQVSTQQAEAALDAAQLGRLKSAYRKRTLGDGGAGLSGGEALRLAMARAAVGPDTLIILADEPTAHLDRETADDITERLLELAKGKTLLVATHDPRLAARIGRTIHLNPEPAREAAE